MQGVSTNFLERFFGPAWIAPGKRAKLKTPPTFQEQRSVLDGCMGDNELVDLLATSHRPTPPSRRVTHNRHGGISERYRRSIAPFDEPGAFVMD